MLSSADQRVVGVGDAFACRRKVATSIFCGPKKTWTSRKRRPISRELRNRSRTCCGCAEVATSKSLGRRPSIRSRTPIRRPGKRHGRAAPSRYRTFITLGSISRREIGCSARTIMRGSKSGDRCGRNHDANATSSLPNRRIKNLARRPPLFIAPRLLSLFDAIRRYERPCILSTNRGTIASHLKGASSMAKFVTDVKKIRERARKHMEKVP